ncbi:MAG: hypothetical protein EZS28_022768 [Streblomastix strix]|uniref:Uncharacterized protein n=1 Tax=Streblomastix strix TaxID=222440 RepID=A0A5J4VHA1_9EUKA|nr:MAG: hypothetical protein EZS28_022768 [Streblomastix strix]
MSKNSIKPEPLQPLLFANFDTPKFTAMTPATTISEVPEMADEIGKFLQSELQQTLQDIERQQLRGRRSVKRLKRLLQSSWRRQLVCKREREVGERLEEEIRTIYEEEKATRIKISHIKRDKVKLKGITYIQSRTSVRQRIQQTGIGYTIMRIEIEEKAGMTIQMACEQNVHKCKNRHPENHCDRDSSRTGDESPQHQVATPQSKQSVLPTQRTKQVQIQPKQQQCKSQDREVGKMHRQAMMTLMNKKYYKESQQHFRKRKNNIEYLTRRTIYNKKLEKQILIIPKLSNLPYFNINK